MAESNGSIFGPINAETGNTSQFTSVGVAGTPVNILTAEAAAKNNGTYGFKHDFNGNASRCEGFINFTEVDAGYFRFYLFVPTGFQCATNYENCGVIGLWDATQEICALNIRSTGSTTPSRWYWEVVGGSSDAGGDATFHLDTWMRIEIHWVAGTGANGIVNITVDGTALTDQTNLARSSDRADNIRIGCNQYYAVPLDGGYFYTDDIKGDSSAIGAYAEEGGGDGGLLARILLS
jgi:hypothetical protein